MQLGSQQETIRAVNRTIRDFADDPRIPPNEPWEFFCECGCFTLVTLTVAEFDTAGPRLGRGARLDRGTYVRVEHTFP
jgi:hypothetical protein